VNIAKPVLTVRYLKTLKKENKSFIISSNRKDIVGSISDDLLNMEDFNES